MARFNGWSPQTAYRAAVGPGVAVANLDEAMLTAATGDAELTDAEIAAIINSGDILGATDDGLSFDYEPEFQDWEFAGVPGNIRGGRRLISATVSVEGSFTEITPENMQKFIPNLDAEDWELGTTPTKIGDILTPRPYIVDTDYMDNLAIIAERQGTNIPLVVMIYNVMNSEGFSLSLEGDENRSATDVTFTGSYGSQDFDASTGRFGMPFKLYLPTEFDATPA
jgi:hypothetical protein